MPDGACFCAEVPEIPTRTRIVIVRHTAEIAKTSNTGRMAARALTNALLVDHGVPGQPLDVSALVDDDARVLYPGPAPAERTEVRTLVVLDGSWSHVRAMRWRIPPLPRLRSLALPAPAVAPIRMRRGQHPDQLATIEAIAGALAVLGEPDAAEALRGVFTTMASRMRELRGFDLPPRWAG
jgi:DTW domain-containing protein YfiP